MEVLGIIIFALIIGSLFFYGFKKRGPWGSFWSFILILFLGMWAVDLWVTPYGPQYWGIAWFDMLFVGFLFAFLLAAATPTHYDRLKKRNLTEKELAEAQQEEAIGSSVAIGIFFWFMLLFFIVLLVIGLFG